MGGGQEHRSSAERAGEGTQGWNFHSRGSHIVDFHNFPLCCQIVIMVCRQVDIQMAHKGDTPIPMISDTPLDLFYTPFNARLWNDK
jgi:hypothetical protein